MSMLLFVHWRHFQKKICQSEKARGLSPKAIKEGKGDRPPGVRRNEGKFDFLVLVVKFGFEGEVTTAF